jgi:muconate cycloisomerase
MRLVRATVYALDIPFVQGVRHRLAARGACDSIVLRVQDDAGCEGYGEGVARPYVTGETVAGVVARLARDLWPAVAGREAPPLEVPTDLDVLDAFVPATPGVRPGSDHAARSALGLAMVDAILRRTGRSLAALLAPRGPVVYGGLVTADSTEMAARQAHQLRLVGITSVKVKVGAGDDVARLRAVREVLPSATIRVDANGAWTPATALAALHALAPFGLAAVEEPLARGPVSALAWLRARSPLPIVADESLVTLGDLAELTEAGAIDGVNVRISKCGGLGRSVALARRAAAAGLAVQVGCHVGETAILAAAGRHLAGALAPVAFAEGSYGTLLLVEDVADETVRFGRHGTARRLEGPGLGLHVRPERLLRYAREVVELVPAGAGR